MSAPAMTTTGASKSSGGIDNNRKYLRTVPPKWMRCKAASGSATQLVYANGATLTFDVPSAVGAYAKGFLIRFAGNIQYTAAGGAPTLSRTPAGPHALFSNLTLLYNGTLQNVRPVWYKYIPNMRGYMRQSVNFAAPGFVDPYIQGQIDTWPITVPAPGANPVNWALWIPLQLHQDDPAGLVPIGTDAGTTLQVQLICAPTNNGPDPVLNCFTSNGTIAITGNVSVDCQFLDGETYWGQSKLSLDLNGVPVIQVLTEQQLNPLTAGSDLVRPLSKLLIHHALMAIVVDGNASTAYSAWNNFTSIGLTKDSSGSNNFWKYGIGGNNIPFDQFLIRQRMLYGGDVLDPGFCLFINGGAETIQNVDNYNGLQNLNMEKGNWTSVGTLYNMTAVNAGNGFTPRVELATILSNRAGFANLQD